MDRVVEKLDNLGKVSGGNITDVFKAGGIPFYKEQLGQGGDLSIENLHPVV